MHVFVCVSNNNGMMFASRRQSRDRKVVSDVLLSKHGDLYINEFSRELFPEAICIQNFPKDCGKGNSFFAENIHLLPYINEIESLTVYHWCRDYPSDFFLDIDPMQHFSHCNTYEFSGSSHKLILKEVWT